jgi:uncharacterized protein YqgC (DUF456 family)
MYHTLGNILSDTNLILTGITLVVMLFGLLLLIIPILPGLEIIWVAALVFGIIAHFDARGWIMFGIITLLVIVGELAEHLLMGTKAHKGGAPWWVVLIVLVVAIAGNFIIPILGGILAGVLALFGIELLRSEDSEKAWAATRGLLVGFAWGFVAKFAAGLLMIAVWCLWAFL